MNLNYLGANIIGYGRKPSVESGDLTHISEYYTNPNLSGFLEKCDYFVNVLPSTIETKGLLNGNTLENCKSKVLLTSCSIIDQIYDFQRMS